MRSGLCGLLLALVPQDQGWTRIWSELETLRGGRASAEERELLRTDLLRALEGCEEGPRRELLRAALGALAGQARRLPPGLTEIEPSSLSPQERWLLADLLPIGPERTRLVLSALAQPGALLEWQVLLAWNTAVDEARALHLVEATLPIQLALHELYASAWSAEDLALTLRKLGREAEADAILQDALARETSPERQAALWERRGLQALGFGHERRARDYLGRGLAGGSEDAGLVLARMDLAQGRVEDARRGFQALILDRPPSDWAWRGWGTSLLPPSHAEPATRPSPPNE